MSDFFTIFATILGAYLLTYYLIGVVRNRCRHRWDIYGRNEIREGTQDEWVNGQPLRIKEIRLTMRCKDCGDVKTRKV